MKHHSILKRGLATLVALSVALNTVTAGCARTQSVASPYDDTEEATNAPVPAEQVGTIDPPNPKVGDHATITLPDGSGGSGTVDSIRTTEDGRQIPYISKPDVVWGPTPQDEGNSGTTIESDGSVVTVGAEPSDGSQGETVASGAPNVGDGEGFGPRGSRTSDHRESGRGPSKGQPERTSPEELEQQNGGKQSSLAEKVASIFPGLGEATGGGSQETEKSVNDHNSTIRASLGFAGVAPLLLLGLPAEVPALVALAAIGAVTAVLLYTTNVDWDSIDGLFNRFENSTDGGILDGLSKLWAKADDVEEGRVENGEAAEEPQPGAVPEVAMGKQGKHIVGHPNYDANRTRSILRADPKELAKKAGKGQPMNNIERGKAGFKERIDFGEVIGDFHEEGSATGTPTTKGMIIYDGVGRIHIVPVRP